MSQGYFLLGIVDYEKHVKKNNGKIQCTNGYLMFSTDGIPKQFFETKGKDMLSIELNPRIMSKRRVTIGERRR
jgi:hypothetical protein